MFDRIVKLLISMTYYALSEIRVWIGRMGGKKQAGRFIVLTYHAVKSGQRRRFALQMEALKRCGTVTCADEANIAQSSGLRIAVTFDDGFASVIENALPEMAVRGIPGTIFVPTGYLGTRAGWITRRDYPNYQERVLTKQQLQELPDEMVRIGSHTVYHRNLAQTEEAEAAAELSRSKQSLEKILARPVHMLSLPYGGCSAGVLDLARQAGYRQIFLNVPADRGNGGSRDVVGRLNASPDDWGLEFYLKVRGAYHWLPIAIRAKKHVRRYLKGAASLRAKRT